jgi:hypothetical protein
LQGLDLAEIAPQAFRSLERGVGHDGDERRTDHFGKTAKG